MSWLKLHREARDHVVFSDPVLWHLFTWCLINANVVQSNWKGTTIEPGQFVTGRNAASAELKIPPSTFSRRIQKLASLGCISVKPDNNWTTITIINWSTYNGIDPEKSEKRTTNGQRTDNERLSNGHQTDTAKELKNLKNEEGKKESGDFVHSENPENLELKRQLADAEERLRRVGENSTYQVGPSPECKHWFQIFPERGRTNLKNCAQSFETALDELQVERQCDRQSAFAILIGITKIYAESWKGRSIYCGSAENFITSNWKNNPATWSESIEPNQKKGVLSVHEKLMAERNGNGRF